MEEKKKALTGNCNFAGIRPAMADLPYPQIQVWGRNQTYANLLTIDYCGQTSELTAITQYINNENRLSYENCSVARTLLRIAIAEMMHLQKLGEMIVLLGGNVNYTAKHRNGAKRMWSPEYLTIPENAVKMIQADIAAEKDAIEQYRMHIKMIQDDCVGAVLARIIKDEEYHIMLLRNLLEDL